MAVAAITASAAGDNLIVTAVPNKKIRVKAFELFNGAATANNAKWRSGTTDLTGLLYSPAALGRIGGMVAQTGDFLFETVAGQALNLNLSAATAVGGYLDYTLE